jgi:hypothetical protein
MAAENPAAYRRATVPTQLTPIVQRALAQSKRRMQRRQKLRKPSGKSRAASNSQELIDRHDAVGGASLRP